MLQHRIDSLKIEKLGILASSRRTFWGKNHDYVGNEIVNQT
jgi:hypothetical protein